MKKLGEAWFKDTQRGCLYQVLAFLIIIPLFCVCFIVPMYFANRPGVSQSESLWMMVIPGALFLLLVLGGVPMVLYISIKRRASWLDEAFGALGLEGRSYAIIGRQYHGTVRGRQVDVFFSRGPLFKMHISTDLKTKVGISDAAAVSTTLAGLFNQEPLEMPELERHNLIVFPHEEEWTRELIRDHQAIRLIDELLHEEHPFMFRQVHLTPGDIMLYLYRSEQMFDFKIAPEQAREWFNQLLRLLEMMEGLPAPVEELEETETERKIRSGEFKGGQKAAVIIVAVIVAMSVCAGIAGLGFVLFLDSM